VLRLLLVLAEVARGVEELLRDDRRAQPDVGERRPLGGLVGAAPLEVRAHRRDVEADDVFAVDPTDLAVVVRDELHPHTFCATSAYVSAVLTSPSMSRFSPSSTSMRPVDVPEFTVGMP